MKSKLNLLMMLFTVILLASCGEQGDNSNAANANDTATADNRNADKEKTTTAGKREEHFIDDVMEINNEEIAWLHAAANSGTDAELKNAAQQMIPDHQQMNQQLREYASKHNIELDDDDTTVIVMDIDKEKGNDWDKEWAKDMTKQHRKMVKKFERAQNRISDAELKDVVDNALPKLRSHLETMNKLEDRLAKNNGK